MKRRRIALVLVVPAILALALAGCGGRQAASPLHVASVFADGEDHGDFRQSCLQVDPKIIRKLWNNVSGCEAYFTIAFAQAVYGGPWGAYKIIPHSAKVKGDSATVKMRWPGGIDTIVLVKIKGVWKVESVQ